MPAPIDFAPIDFARVASALASLVDGGDKFTIRQLAVLSTLCASPGPHRVRHMAAELRVAKPIVTRAINVLEAAGLAKRQQCPIDRRDVLITATELGRIVHAGVTRG